MAVSVDFRSSENLSKSTNEEFARLVAPYQVEIKKKPDRDAETIIVVSAGHGLDYLGEVKLMEPDSDFCWAKVKLNNNIGWVIVNKDWGEVVLIEGTFASADSSIGAEVASMSIALEIFAMEAFSLSFKNLNILLAFRYPAVDFLFKGVCMQA